MVNEPAENYWLYEGGHHFSLMRGPHSLGSIRGISPSVDHTEAPNMVRKALEELGIKLNEALEVSHGG